ELIVRCFCLTNNAYNFCHILSPLTKYHDNRASFMLTKVGAVCGHFDNKTGRRNVSPPRIKPTEGFLRSNVIQIGIWMLSSQTPSNWNGKFIISPVHGTSIWPTLA